MSLKKAHDVVEEGDGCSLAGVAQRDEVCVFRKPVDHDYYDAFAMYLGESFDEIHRYVCPDTRRHG